MFDVGDSVPLAVEIRDASGALTSGTGVAIAVTLPDGTAGAAPAISNPSTGRYEAAFPAAVAGRHVVRWTSTSPLTAYTDMFDVRSTAPPAIVSLLDAKKALNKSLTDTTDDEELRTYIEAATAACERYRNEVIVRRTIVEKRRVRDVPLYLGQVPAISLTSIARIDGTQSWSTTDLDLDSTSGAVRVKTGPLLSGEVVIIYVAGYQEVPANFSLAALIVIRNLWDLQRQAGIGPNPFGGTEQAFVPPEVLIPPRAAQLLGSGRPLIA